MQYSKYFTDLPKLNHKYIGRITKEKQEKLFGNNSRIVIVGNSGTGKMALIQHTVQNPKGFKQAFKVNLNQFMLDLQQNGIQFPLTKVQFQKYILHGLLEEINALHKSFAAKHLETPKPYINVISYFYFDAIYFLLNELTVKQAEEFNEEIQKDFYYFNGDEHTKHPSTINIFYCFTEKQWQKICTKTLTQHAKNPYVLRHLAQMSKQASWNLEESSNQCLVHLRSAAPTKTAKILRSVANSMGKPITPYIARQLVKIAKHHRGANPKKSIIALDVYLGELKKAEKEGADKKQLQSIIKHMELAEELE